MNNHELLNIMEEIKEAERTDLAAIAEKCDIDRSYLSKLVNMDEEKDITKGLLRKLHKGYPGYFPENNINNSKKAEPYLKEYIDLLKEDRLLLADIIKINLTTVIETIRTVATRQEADEEVMLRSLARLEGKPENQLFQDAGMRRNQIEKDAEKYGK